jgi:tripartite-type tricarboxylate transporter receptor subunit TctC
MATKNVSIIALMAAFVFAMPAGAQNGADNYPSRPIRMLVPLSPGTTTDVVARTFAGGLFPGTRAIDRG